MSKTPATAPTLQALAWSRLAFGPTPAELADYQRPKLSERARFEAFVEAQLHPEAVKDPVCDAKLGALQLDILTKSPERLWQDYAVAANKLKEMAKQTANKEDENELRQRPLRETEAAAWTRALYSRRQLHETLTDFWHTHFSIFGPGGEVAPSFAAFDRDVIRAHGLGNFRDLLERVAQSPAMLFYLDNHVNQSGNPNENYARELFELHTLGAGNYLGTAERGSVPGYAKGVPTGYVDGDVYEAARCFTGWRVDAGGKSGDTGRFQYFDQWHDRFQKIVLGHAIPEHQPPMKDGRDVLDLLVAHPGTAQHVARRLCQRLVADDPPAALVAAAAATFRAKAAAPDQLRQVVRTIVLSPEFAATPQQKLRRPFELMVAALRATGADVTVQDDFLKDTARGGQRLFQWRTPDGYPDRREKWGGTAAMIDRWRFCNQLMAGNLPGTKIDVVAATPAQAATPGQIADHWLFRLYGQVPSAKTRAAVVSFLAQGRSASAPLPAGLREERIGPAVALALMAPEVQVR